MESVLKQLAEELGGKTVVGKVYDSERNLFKAFSIKGVPTVMIFRDGELKESFVGGGSKETLKRAIEKYAP